MARRASYLPLHHDDCDLALYRREKTYGGGRGPLTDPATLERVKARLRAGCRVVLVARECGYRHLPTFYRAFTKALGMPPAAWRDAQKDGGSAKPLEDHQ